MLSFPVLLTGLKVGAGRLFGQISEPVFTDSGFFIELEFLYPTAV